MRTVGPGVSEIRIRTGTEDRVFYVARFEEAVCVLHAVQKRTQRTHRADIALARARLREVVKRRRRGPAIS